ncbi:hypothetical protein BU25DRAFT_348858 [Macroventuria anomochaeta]|uniref:Uncharacterized protein n=1 Tax=Macroventuria anomochaeta TaxID=301207 RepID=A0ACB6RS26_9PLEO|nr:uncharacterized protein BU25DRAFT_348858 [Macroventuria anomochaeta]KAF2623948.1 hypothetical protein BU25DRAFT_348858 [Macroventuria anomochaeta]
MVREHGSLMKDAETNQAAWEAAKGAAYGGVKWGAFFAVAGGVAYAFSPLYRGLTVQFKTYIQMSAMVFGGMIEADSRMVKYQLAVRQQKKLQTDMAAWRAYEKEFEEHGTPGVASESNVARK